MQMNEDRGDVPFHIVNVKPDAIQVNDQILSRNFIISHDALDKDWCDAAVESITQDELSKLLDYDADIYLLGVGNKHQFPKTELLKPFIEKGVTLEVMTTAAACRTFTILTSEYRRVVAGILL